MRHKDSTIFPKTVYVGENPTHKAELHYKDGSHLVIYFTPMDKNMSTARMVSEISGRYTTERTVIFVSDSGSMVATLDNLSHAIVTKHEAKNV